MESFSPQTLKFISTLDIFKYKLQTLSQRSYPRRSRQEWDGKQETGDTYTLDRQESIVNKGTQ